MKYFTALILSFCSILIPQSTSGQVIINELLSSNGAVNLNSETTRFSDWIELYNSSDSQIDLAGYHLSDNQDNPSKWTFPPLSYIPAHGFLIVYADKLDNGLHTNFGLSKEGEEVVLHDSDGNLQDIIEFPEQKSDISYGRNPDDIGQWLYFGEPSPGEENNEFGVSRPILTITPTIEPEAGFYGGPISASLAGNPSAGISIHYTIDGSTPTRQSPVFPGEIEIPETTILKTRAFENEKLRGLVSTKTYFINENKTLPVFSISMNPYYLWDDEVGIYIDGSSFNGQRSSRNSCQVDWERPMHIEFFDDNGELIFGENAGIQVKGRMNCEFPKKPLGIYFRSKYGENVINYPFFRDKDVTMFSSFILRPGGADGIGNRYNGTMIRDGLLGNMLAGQMDIDYEGFRPAVLFINGEYWGIHNIRERNKSDYLAGNHGVDPDSLDILENPSNGAIIKGDDLKYKELLNFVGSNTARNDTLLSSLSQFIDVQEFLNYQIAEIFVNNEDWAHNNVLCWRPRVADGVFRWVFFDIEGGFGLYDDDDYFNNLFNYKEDNFLRHKYLFDRLLLNPRIKSDFIQGFAAHLNSTFSPDRIINMINSMSSEIELEMEKDVIRWDGYQTDGGAECSPINSMAQWRSHLTILENFAKLRPDIIWQQLSSKFGLSGSIQLDLLSEGGSISVNGVANAKSGQYFAGVPIRLSAIPDPGYEFIGWEGIDGDRDIEFTATEDQKMTALFAIGSDSILPSNIRENVILSKQNSPYLATSDIIVESTGILRISPGVEIRMAENASIYVYGILQSSGNLSEPVIIRSDRGSKKRWGSLVFNEALSGSIIQNTIIRNASSAKLDPLLFKANLNIIDTYVPVDGLIIEDADYNPVYVLNANADIRNSTLYSLGVGDYINVAESDSTTIENCTFIGNDASDTDAIDLDAVLYAQIQGNSFRNFRGSNSDGLDIGYSPNINILRNVFSNISDKGISIGMGSLANIKQNIFLNCTDGIGVKDENSTANVDRNTFFDNNFGVRCFEKEPGRGGGYAIIQNSIFGGKDQLAGSSDEYSSIEYSYCWDTKYDLPGEHNKIGDPEWIDQISGNFWLSAKSPCRDAGNPDSDPDPDDTRADLGAYYFHTDQYSEVFLNEMLIENNNLIIEIVNMGYAAVSMANLLIGPSPVPLKMLSLVSFAGGQTSIAPGEYIALQVPSKYYISMQGKRALILYQNINEEFIQLSGLPISPYLNDFSIGAFPNGTHSVRHFSTPTPGAKNQAEPSGKGQLFINEILADNGNFETDIRNSYQDWFELFNAGDNAINLEGLYVTDNLDEPTKHQIERSSEIDFSLDSKQFQLFWADKNDELGINHVGFKLNAEKEELGIFAVLGPDTIMVDSVLFADQITNKSFGRYPDGNANLASLLSLSPGRSNVLLNIKDRMNSFTANLFPNPFSDILYLQLSGAKIQDARLQILNMKGQILSEMALPNQGSETHSIKLSHLSSGVYIARILTSVSITSARIFKK